MIIIGTRGITYSKASGTFYCPGCSTERGFKQKRLRRFFTLYFVPIIPLDLIQEYVECTQCKSGFRPEVLDYSPERAHEDAVQQFHDTLLRTLVLMTLADGHIDDEELVSVKSIFAAITGQELSDTTLRQALRDEDGASSDVAEYLGSIAWSLSDHGKETVLKAAFLVATADNELADSEMQLMLRIGHVLGLSEAHFRATLQETLSAPGPSESMVS